MGKHGRGGRRKDEYKQRAYYYQQQAQTPYGGHPLQQQRPDLQYSTQQLDNAAQYHHDNIAEEYLRRHEAAHTLAHGLESASEAANELNPGNPRNTW